MKIDIYTNEKLADALNVNPQFNNERHFAMIDNIHISALDYLSKDELSDNEQKLEELISLGQKTTIFSL